MIAGCTVNVQAPPPAPSRAVAPRLNPSTRLTAADIGALPPLGEHYSGSLPLLGKTLPLPDGDWQVVVQQRNTFAGYPPGAQVVLLRTQQRQMTGVLEISGNAVGHASDRGWPINVICQSASRLGTNPQVLAADAREANPGGDQDCVLVGFLTTARWRAAAGSQALQGLSRSLDTLGIVPPPTAIVAAFGETDNQYRLMEQIWLNPDLAGIAPDPEPRPLVNAWAYDKLAGDRARQAYIDRVMAWAESWRPVVRQSLQDPAAVAPAGVAEIR
jgi:hypothetical protein